MTSELKTLKDLMFQPVQWLNGETGIIEDMPEQNAICGVKELKAEAVKHIKYFKACNSLPKVILDFNYSQETVDAVIRYIMWENNLTEADLQEKKHCKIHTKFVDICARCHKAKKEDLKNEQNK
jgi:hypothetical protein